MSLQLAPNIFDNIDALNLTKRQRGPILGRLKEFLERSRSRVALVLRGWEKRKWSQKSMRKLERELLTEFTYRPLACDMLRILRKACNAWAMKNDPEASLPRLGVLIKPFENPLNQNLPRRLLQYRGWEQWLRSELEKDAAKNITRKNPKPIQSIAPLLVSSILYGGLFEKASILTFVREFPHLSLHTLASKSAMYVGLDVPWGGFGQTEFRCWQPDTLTATILARTSPLAALELLREEDGATSPDLHDSVLSKRIARSFHQIRKAELQREGGAQLCDFESLIKAVQTIAYIQMPAIIAAYGSRKFRSDSLPFEVMVRIPKHEWIIRPQADMTRVPELPSSNSPTASSDTGGPPLWTVEFTAAIHDEMEWKLVRNNLRKLAESESIPPLARRLADFAERTFSIRTMFDKRRSARTMRKRVQVLADAISSVRGVADITDLLTESLEDLYRDAIQDFRKRGKRPREVNALIRALRELHAYLCALHGKRPLSNDKLLVALPVLDRTDANILTIEEYHRLLSMIELEWDADEPYERREIAKLLVILGYRAGLRAEEARLLRVSDAVFDGREELWIRPSPGHTLKSHNSLRRVELRKLLEKLELDELRHWVNGRNAGSDDFLFKTGVLEVVPQSIFFTINRMIARITGIAGKDGIGHFHHCRHSLASLGFVRLMIGKHVTVLELFKDSSTTSDWFAKGANHFYRSSFPNRRHAFLLARVLGHGHPATTVRYIHIFGILLHHFIRRAPLMQPDPALLRLASGRTDTEPVVDLDGRHAMSAALEILGRRDDLRSPDPHLVNSEALGKVVWEPRRWIVELRKFLRYAEGSGLSQEEAARRFGLDPQIAKQMVERAQWCATVETDNGVQRHRIREFEPELATDDELNVRTLPRSPVQKADLEVVDMFAGRIYDLGSDSDSRTLLTSGVEAYVYSVWSSRSYPVFCYERNNGQDARAFRHLLESCDIRLNQIEFISFDPASPSRWPNLWRKALGFSEGIRIDKRTSLFFDREDTRSWLEIRPTFPVKNLADSKGVGVFGFRYLMIMSFIAFGSANFVTPKDSR